MGKLKEIGHCSCCRDKMWARDTLSDIWPGVCATMLLADGSTMDLTLCDACAESPDFDVTWENILEGWAFEGAIKYTAIQSSENFILCLLYAMPWARKSLNGAVD